MYKFPHLEVEFLKLNVSSKYSNTIAIIEYRNAPLISALFIYIRIANTSTSFVAKTRKCPHCDEPRCEISTSPIAKDVNFHIVNSQRVKIYRISLYLRKLLILSIEFSLQILRIYVKIMFTISNSLNTISASFYHHGHLNGHLLRILNFTDNSRSTSLC